MKKVIFALAVGLMLINCKNAPEIKPEEVAIKSTEDGKVLLRLAPNKGEEMNMKMIVDMNVGDQMNVDMEMNMNMNVMDVQDSIATYNIKFNRIISNTQAMGMTMEYDSDNETQEGMAAMLDEQMKPILASTVKMEMNQLGKITSIDLGEMAKSPQASQMDFGGMSVKLPKEPVGVGDSWSATRSIDDGQGGQMDINMNLTLKSITDTEIAIDMVGDITGEGAQAMSSDISGNYTLDRKTSFTTNGEIDMKMDAQGQTVNIKTQFKKL